MDEALDRAVELMTEAGVGALTVSEVARRMGIRGPSLYKYFPSLHGMYDALFARGLAESGEVVGAAIDAAERGVPALRAAARALVRWAVENPALAQLLFWRPVPGFEPSPGVFAASQQDMSRLAEELQAAVALGQLAREAATDEGSRLWTVLLSGVISQQLANEPGVAYEDGRFSRLTDSLVELFVARYAPDPTPPSRPRPSDAPAPLRPDWRS